MQNTNASAPSAETRAPDEISPSPWGAEVPRSKPEARDEARDEEERAWSRVWEVDAPVAVVSSFRTQLASGALLEASARQAAWEIVHEYSAPEGADGVPPAASSRNAAPVRRPVADSRFDDRPPGAWTGMFFPIAILVAIVTVFRVMVH